MAARLPDRWPAPLPRRPDPRTASRIAPALSAGQPDQEIHSPRCIFYIAHGLMRVAIPGVFHFRDDGLRIRSLAEADEPPGRSGRMDHDVCASRRTGVALETWVARRPQMSYILYYLYTNVLCYALPSSGRVTVASVPGDAIPVLPVLPLGSPRSGPPMCWASTPSSRYKQPGWRSARSAAPRLSTWPSHGEGGPFPGRSCPPGTEQIQWGFPGSLGRSSPGRSE